MKKLILLSIALLLSGIMFSQIKVTKLEKPILVGKVQFFKCYKSSGIYTLKYRDLSYKTIKVYESFSLNEKDFDDLYSVIEQGFIDVPKERIIVETPDDILYLKFAKTMGVVSFRIYHYVSKTEIVKTTKYLTKNATKKLFGK